MPNPFSAWVIREKDETATEFSTPVEVHVPSTPVAYDILNDPLDAESEEEASVNAVIDATPILETGDDTPDLSPQLLWAFCVDVAQNVQSFSQIAIRYGFTDVARLRDFLRDQPMVRRRAKEMRAVWESDDNVDDRIKKLSGHAVLAALPETAKIMLDPRTPNETRLNAMQKHATIAGVYNPPGARGGAVVAGAGPGVGRFSVNIVFQNAGKTETITTIEHAPDSHVEHPDNQEILTS
jgi:hypothetical protein